MKNNNQKTFKQVINFLIACCIPAVLLLFTWILFPANVNLGTVGNMIYQSVPNCILAWGVLFCFKAGLIDLTAGANFLVSSIIGGNIALSLGLGFFGVLIFCALFGVIIGACIGLLDRLLNIPSIVISIGAAYILESIACLVYKGGGVGLTFDYLKLNTLWTQALFGVIAGALAYYLYNINKIGIHLQAVGNNPTIAAEKGINVKNAKFTAYVICGLFAGLYAVSTLGSTGVVRTVSNLGSISTVFNGMLCMLTAFALERYINVIFAVFIGSFSLQTVKLLLMLLGINSNYTSVVVSLFVLLTMCITSYNDIREKVYLEKHRFLAEGNNGQTED